MDYSFLDDPDAIAEILASAEPEHRAMQSAQGWDDKTLAIEIATSRHRESNKSHAQEEEEWKERVLRMSDEDLEMEDDVIRAEINPVIVAHQAMSDEDKEKNMLRFVKTLRWAKTRLAFTKEERESRAEKAVFKERVKRANKVADLISQKVKDETEAIFPKLHEKHLLDDFMLEIMEEGDKDKGIPTNADLKKQYTDIMTSNGYADIVPVLYQCERFDQLSHQERLRIIMENKDLTPKERETKLKEHHEQVERWKNNKGFPIAGQILQTPIMILKNLILEKNLSQREAWNCYFEAKLE